MKQWIIKKNEYSGQNSLGINPAIAAILHDRGIRDEDIPDFLSDRPQTAYDPFLMKGMSEAVDMIIRHADNGGRIFVYGDYDADGVTAAALLVQVLGLITDHPGYYIPSRFTDGYGLNKPAIEKIRQKGATLLITVDCGSTSRDETDYAMQLGMDVIVTDHHTIDESRSPECLFINPKQSGCEYPFKWLSGCGIAFKLAQALQRRLSELGRDVIERSFLHSLLDLVAIAAVADVVPLVDENRTLLKYGLEYINRREREGLRVLLELLQSSDRVIDSDVIAFMIAPNINALGRMESADVGVELFCGYDPDGEKTDRSKELAQRMIDANILRKSFQEKTFEICKKSFDRGDCGEYFPIILADGAHEGVAGIVAGNFKETLYRPVCVVTPCGDGTLKGTGRSVADVNMHACMSECADLFLRFGGHSGACGFLLKESNLTQFRQKMQETVKRLFDSDPSILTEKIYIERELTKDDKNISFARELKKLEPFGEGNLQPVFFISHAETSYVRTLGSDNQHLRFTARSDDGISVDCILFKKADEYIDMLRRNKYVDIAGQLTVNEYNGTEKLQFTVADIRGSRK